MEGIDPQEKKEFPLKVVPQKSQSREALQRQGPVDGGVSHGGLVSQSGLISPGFQKQLEKAVAMQLSSLKRTEGGDKLQGSVNPRFVGGMRFPVLQIMVKHVAIREVLSRHFPGIPQNDPRKSHSPLELSEVCPVHPFSDLPDVFRDL